MGWISRIASWMVTEYMTDMRESRARVYETIVKNNLHLNTVILTVSVASLTAVAALSSDVFESNPWLSIVVITLFIAVILLSTINFYLTGLALRDIQQKLSKDVLFPFKISRGVYIPKYVEHQKILNKSVLYGFCLGLVSLLVLLTAYILGGTL